MRRLFAPRFETERLEEIAGGGSVAAGAFIKADQCQ